MKTRRYTVSKENGGFFVADKKIGGVIIAYFTTKTDAEEYVIAQNRSDEQSEVMSEFNGIQLTKELMAELREELSSKRF